MIFLVGINRGFTRALSFPDLKKYIVAAFDRIKLHVTAMTEDKLLNTIGLRC